MTLLLRSGASAELLYQSSIPKPNGELMPYISGNLYQACFPESILSSMWHQLTFATVLGERASLRPLPLSSKEFTILEVKWFLLVSVMIIVNSKFHSKGRTPDFFFCNIPIILLTEVTLPGNISPHGFCFLYVLLSLGREVQASTVH